LTIALRHRAPSDFIIGRAERELSAAQKAPVSERRTVVAGTAAQKAPVSERRTVVAGTASMVTAHGWTR
jgi:hypothetical protein